MSFHTVAYSATQSSTVETDTTPIPDGIMVIQNAHFLPQVDMKLVYACYMCATATQARIITPTFRQISTPYIRPIQPTIAGADLTRLADYSQNMLTVKGLEELQVNAKASTAVQGTVVLGLSRSGLMPAPQGNIITMLGTGAATGVALTWAAGGTITWHDTLPSGQYACVGFRAWGATMQTARLTFENQWERPGCVACATAAQASNEIFAHGRLGVWGNFFSYRLPSIEFLCNTTDSAQEYYLDFIKIG